MVSVVYRYLGFGKQTLVGIRVGDSERGVSLSLLMMIKDLPAMRETWVRSLGWEDPLKEGMATHSSILA